MDLTTYARFALALIFVLALIGVLTALARRFGLGGLAHARRGGARRLGILEVLAVDGKRRLVLIRRDDTEHLLLIGGEGDVVIERDCKTDGSFRAALATAKDAAPNETDAPGASA